MLRLGLANRSAGRRWLLQPINQPVILPRKHRTGKMSCVGFCKARSPPGPCLLRSSCNKRHRRCLEPYRRGPWHRGLHQCLALSRSRSWIRIWALDGALSGPRWWSPRSRSCMGAWRSRNWRGTFSGSILKWRFTRYLSSGKRLHRRFVRPWRWCATAIRSAPPSSPASFSARRRRWKGEWNRQ